MKKYCGMVSVLLIVLAFILYKHVIRVHHLTEILGGKDAYWVIAKPDRTKIFVTLGYYWKTTNGFPPLPEHYGSPAGRSHELSESDVKHLQEILLDLHNYRRGLNGAAPFGPEIVIVFARSQHEVQLVAADDFGDIQTTIDGKLKGHSGLKPKDGSIIMQFISPIISNEK